MFISRIISIYFLFILALLNTKTMAQSTITINDVLEDNNSICIINTNALPAAKILKKYLDKSFTNPFLIKDNFKTKKASIHLIIEPLKSKKEEPSFYIKSDEKDIYLIATNEQQLIYGVYTLLEEWGFRKFTATDYYIPKTNQFIYPKNFKKTYRPSFEYRVLYYPDAFDKDFREWHKLDWHKDDFSIWGHTFNELLPSKLFFKNNPEYFAFYEGKRRAESICMTNEMALQKIIAKITQIISDNPNATFLSVSQNDDTVFCQCEKCSILNQKHGGPQGSLYFFFNKIAKHFPKIKIVTLAYQHTFQPPINLKISPNIYTLICPIELNRAKSITSDNNNLSFEKTLNNWRKLTPNLYLWDYTVQFSNYLSPFPNINTFSENYKYFKKQHIKGLFVQGYADVPGDFSELRQYLLAKLLWNAEIDIKAITADFLKVFYGNAAPYVQEYLNLLAINQEQSKKALDIYSGPIQNRNTFLSPKAMDEYDLLLNEATISVQQDSILSNRIKKLRLALEFVYFEQSKFYGTDTHGMFLTNSEGKKQVKPGLTERVQQFTTVCNELGIYELSEDGISPNKYYENWLEISKNTTVHLGEKLKVNFLTPPFPDFLGKGSASLVDGIKGHTDYNMNWVGWYGNNPEIEIITNKIAINRIKINFLDNQRNWIFIPRKIKVYGYINNEWIFINEVKNIELKENFEIKSKSIEIIDSKLSGLERIKIEVENQTELPFWRTRKNKKPMVMIDEIELYNQ